MRRRGMYRWIAVGLIAAVGLYFVVDVVMLKYVESESAAQLIQALSAEDGTVSFGNVPFLPSFLSGHLSHVESKIRGASGPGGLRIAEFDTTLSDVSFPAGKAFALVRSRFAGRAAVKAGQALVHIELTGDDMEAYLKDKLPSASAVKVTPAGVEIAFSPPADTSQAFGTSPGGTGSGDRTPPPPASRYLPRVDGRRFSLELLSVFRVPIDFREDALRISELISLPTLPEGLRADIKLGDGVIVIEATGRDVKFPIGYATS